MTNNRPSDRLYIYLYCFTNLALSFTVGSLGPLIPYLAKARQKTQTQYSFLFSARTMGSLTAFVLLRFIQKIDHKHYEHKLIALAGAIYCMFLLTFVWFENTLFECLSFFVIGACHFVIFTLINICLLEVAQQKTGEYMPLTYAFFGTGALLAPFFVRIMEIKCYYAFFLAFVALTAAYIYFPTPTHEKHAQQQNQKKKLKDVPQKLQILFGLVFFFQIGVEITVAGWFPTYAVITGAFDVQTAVFSGTLFWGMITLFRFIAAGLKIPCSQKITILANSIFSVSFITFFLDFAKSYQISSVVGSLGFGFSCSAVLSLLMSIPVQFGFKLKPEQISNMIVMMSLAPIILTSTVGWLMEKKVNNLIYSLVVISGAVWVCIHLLLRYMKMEKDQNQNETMREMIEK